MATLEILKYPNKSLRQKAEPVTFPLTDEQREFIKDLTDTMYFADGAGLGANQVGRREAIFVVGTNRRDGGGKEPIVFINPQIVEHSRDTVKADEGCLSFPGIAAKVERYKEITIRAQDVAGNWFDCAADSDDYMARALQHEMDHMEGRLFIDRLGPISREFFLKKYNKQQKDAREIRRRIDALKTKMDTNEPGTGTETSSSAS